MRPNAPAGAGGDGELPPPLPPGRRGCFGSPAPFHPLCAPPGGRAAVDAPGGAGLSTLEGILLALSATFSVDFYPLLTREPSEVRALRFGRAGLVFVGVATVGLALWQLEHPTGGTVAIFAQYGVYLLFTASFLPLACGMFVPRATRGLMAAGVFASVATYLAMDLFSIGPLSNNPAVLATAGILAGWAVVGVGLVVRAGPTARGTASTA